METFKDTVTDSLNSLMGLDEYGCFKELEIQEDEDYIEDGVCGQYNVKYKYLTRNGDDLIIYFNVRPSDDNPNEFGSDDFEINTYEDSWHGVSTFNAEPLWLCLLDKVEAYYLKELKKK